MSRICTIDLAFTGQAYVEAVTNAVLKETEWTAGLFNHLVKSDATEM